jgi:hypothetical protein
MRQYLEEKILGVYRQQVAVGASPAPQPAQAQASNEAAAKEGSEG